MHRLCSSVVLLISGMSLFACVSGPAVSARLGNFPVRGKVSTISRAGLAAAVAEATTGRVYAVHVIDRNHVRVDLSDDIHDVGNYDERGRYYVERFHGDPMYVIVKRVHGKWERGDAIITTY